MRGQLAVLKQQQAILEDEYNEVRKPRQQRLDLLSRIYEDTLLAVEFPNLQSSRIDRFSLTPEINGVPYTNMGAALSGVATLCYHLSLLQLSLMVDTYFPSMLIIDSPAVGELNEENHDALLRFLASMQRDAEQDDFTDENDRSILDPEDEPDWQIILTNNRVTTDLIPYVKMELSSPDHMLLRHRERP